MPGGKVQNG